MASLMHLVVENYNEILESSKGMYILKVFTLAKY